MSKTSLFVLWLLLITLFGFGCSGSNSAAARLDSKGYVDAFLAAGFPIDNIIVYDEETDVNNLLGRPGEYTSKVNFADLRIEQYSDEPTGGTVEVFASKKDAEDRKSYIETVQETVSLLGGQYIYLSSNGLALLRLEYDLTPSQAEQYRIAFDEIAQSGDATPQEIQQPAGIPRGDVPVSAAVPEEQETLSYNDLGDLFALSAIYPTKPNSAGGVTAVIMYETYSDEEIKYLTFSVAPYNAVDDKVASEIGRRSDIDLKVSGPIPKGSDHYVDFENVWYNSTIKYLVVSSISIEYMNGDVVMCDRDIPVDKRD